MPATQNSGRLFARWENTVVVGPEGTVLGWGQMRDGEELPAYKNT